MRKLFTVGVAWTGAKEAYSRQSGLAVGSTFLLLAIMIPLGLIHSAIQEQVSDPFLMYGLTGVFGVFVMLPAAMFLRLGQIRILLRIYRCQETSIWDLFGQGRWFVSGFLASTLFEVAAGLVVAPVMVLALAFSAPTTPWVGLGASAVSTIPYLLLSVPFSLWILFLLERNLSPLAALQASYQAARGHYGYLFRLMLIGGLVIVVGMLFCGVGLLTLQR